MSPKKKADKGDVGYLDPQQRAYVGEWKKVANHNPWVKRGFEMGERVQRETALILAGGDLPESKLPFWVQSLYKRLPFLNPEALPLEPKTLGWQAGQAIALALHIRDKHRQGLKSNPLSLRTQADLEIGNWLFDLADAAISWAQTPAAGTEVPMAFQSALAGIFLAAEVMIADGRLRNRPIPNTARLRVLEQMPETRPHRIHGVGHSGNARTALRD